MTDDLAIVVKILEFVKSKDNVQDGVKQVLLAIMTVADTSDADFMLAFEEATATYFGATE